MTAASISTVAAGAATVGRISGLSQRLNTGRALSTESTERPEAMRHHTPTTGPPAATLTDLLMRFGRNWSIEYESALGVWSAGRCSPDGRRRHFVCGDRPAELFVKLVAAESSS